MDNIKFSSILCSQICHDLAGSIGVIDNTLDLINPEDLTSFPKDDYHFVSKAAKQAIIQIKFIRTVFGNSSNSISFNEAFELSKLYLGLKKIQLFWNNDSVTKEIEAKLIMSILYGSKIILPYGGSIKILQKNSSDFEIKLKGEKVIYFENIIPLLNSKSSVDLGNSKFLPFMYAGLLSKEKQFNFNQSIAEDKITYIAYRN